MNINPPFYMAIYYISTIRWTKSLQLSWVLLRSEFGITTLGPRRLEIWLVITTACGASRAQKPAFLNGTALGRFHTSNPENTSYLTCDWIRILPWQTTKEAAPPGDEETSNKNVVLHRWGDERGLASSGVISWPEQSVLLLTGTFWQMLAAKEIK